MKKNETQIKRSPASWVPTLYFAMGMPFVVLNMVCTLMYKGMGVSDKQIAFWTSLIIFPWTLKPLWSPFLEMYKSKKFFVVTTQLLTGVLFALIAFALHLPTFFAITVALLAVIAFSGAFYNIAKIAATGGLVYLAGFFIQRFGVTQAWMLVMLIIAVLMVAIGIYHYFMLPQAHEKAQEKKLSLQQTWDELAKVFLEFFKKPHIVYYICFIILYRFAEGFVMKIVPLFLKAPREMQGLGLSEQEIGLCYGTFGAAAFVIGSILAGYYIAWRGLKKSLFSLALVFNIPFVAYTLLAYYQPHSLLLIGGGIVLEYFGYGFGFVGLTLFMMQQVARGKHQMAHYAFASGLMNLGVLLPGMASGLFSDALGYKHFFFFVLICTIPALLITWFVPFTYPEEGGKETSEKV